MKFRSRVFNNKDKAENFWTSFVDIMTTMSLVFFVVMVIVVLSILKQGKDISALNDKLDNISQFRDQLYKDVGNEINKSSLKDAIDYNQTNGEMNIKADLLFDSNKYELKPETNQLIDQLRDVIAPILDKYGSKIEYFEIVGHTDMKNTGTFNRELSLNRARVFADKLVGIETDFEKKYGNKIKASGMSEYEPKFGKINEQTADEMTRNRRIEVRIVYDNSDVNKAVEEYKKLNK